MEKAALQINKRRYWELDFLRGFCVILMVIDHFMFSSMWVLPTVWEFCGVEFWKGLNQLALFYWDNYARNVAQYTVVTIFFLICGISCTLTRSNLHRGLKAAGAALVITLATLTFSSLFGLKNTADDLTILFGVIHMLASSMLIYRALSLLGRLIKKTGKFKRLNGRWPEKVFDWLGRLFPSFVGLTVLILFFALGWGRFGLFEGEWGRFPRLYPEVTIQGSDGLKSFISLFIELKNGGFYSADYFPLVPYAAVVLIGSGIGQLVYNTRAKSYAFKLDGKWNKPVTWVGRRALIVYLIHQVAVAIFFFGMGAIFYLIQLR